MFLRKIIDKFNGSAERHVHQLTRILIVRDMKIEALEDNIEILKSINFAQNTNIEALEVQNKMLKDKYLTKASVVAKPTKAKKKKKKNA